MVAACADIDQLMNVSELLPSLLICDLTRVGHDDRGGEMDDGFRPGAPRSMPRSRLVPAITDNERRVRRHRPVEAGCRRVR
jgi:hypothetical protein